MMNLQNIIVFLIIGVSAFITIRGIVRKFVPPKGGNESCSTCKGCPVSDACKTSKKVEE
ncbi:MAG: FeoB-associated Cys-rich membrane protein [Bacteroidales bacterium]|nr:FeoB-associated Cys-rich membrane protein [Bacteroidales bacterium]